MNRTRPFWVPTIGRIDYRVQPTSFSGKGAPTADESMLKSVSDIDVDAYRASGIRLEIVGLRVTSKPATAIPISGRWRTA